MKTVHGRNAPKGGEAKVFRDGAKFWKRYSGEGITFQPEVTSRSHENTSRGWGWLKRNTVSEVGVKRDQWA